MRAKVPYALSRRWSKTLVVGLASATLLAGAFACNAILGNADGVFVLDGGSGEAGLDATDSPVGDGGAVDSATDGLVLGDGACSGHAGPSGVRVGGYCIDSTEVTNAQYAMFLEAGVAPQTQSVNCKDWNGSFVPRAPDGGAPDGGPLLKWPFLPGTENYPVAWVNYCSAEAFCNWAGKRLCGRIGGGASAVADQNNANVSEWYRACSKADTRTYPYGSAYDPSACNGPNDAGVGKLVDVGALPKCVGGYPGIHDMSGNVYEWENSCDGELGPNGGCRVRGGSIYSAGYLACNSTNGGPRAFANDDLGIRCCSE